MTYDRQGFSSASRRKSPHESRADGQLNEQILRRLRGLPFLSFERCVCGLLLAMGYRSAEILDRFHFRGKNSRGGADIEAFGAVGLSPTTALVQAKHSAEPVPGRYVDQLRGAMLRMGAQQGLIVTAWTFSPVARASARGSGFAPVRLIDGHELARLLLRYRVGVRPGLEVVLKIDDAFFDRLSSESGRRRPTIPNDPQ